ncbi:hypothetical protein FRB97_000650, partial [Tulasnella sp. 331]
MPDSVGYASRSVECSMGAGCKAKDGSKITLGELCFASFRNGHGEDVWKHWECVGRKQGLKLRNKYNPIGIDHMEGYLSLTEIDKARVLDKLHLVEPHVTKKPDLTPPIQPINVPDVTPAPSNNQSPPGPVECQPEGHRPEPTSHSIPAPAPNASGFTYYLSEPPKPWSRLTARPTSSASSEELKDLGNLNYRMGAYETAISYYTQAIANRAAALMTLKHFRPALDDCYVAALLSHHAPYYKTLARLAKCHLALGDHEAALTTAQASIDCDTIRSPDNPSSATKASAELMKKHLDQCIDAWQRKSWKEAKQCLSDAIALCEGGPTEEWSVWDIEMAMARCDWAEVAIAANAALELHPNSAKVQIAAAQVNFFINRVFAGVFSLLAALRLEPGSIHAGTLLSRLEAIIQAQQAGDRLYVAGRFLDSSMKYSDALDIIGSVEAEGRGGYLRVALLGSRAETYLQTKRFDLARDDGLAALSIPNHPWRLEILDKLARCYIALGDADAALRQVGIALEIDPSDQDMLAIASVANRIQLNLRQSRDSWDRKEWLDAKHALARAIAECPGECPIQWRIRTVEMEMATRNWDGAVRTAEAVVALDPASAHALVLLGLTRMLSNNLTSCFEPLQSALRLDSGHPTGSDEEVGGGGYLRAFLLAKRAAALLKMGRSARALADVVVSLELQPASLDALHTHARVRMAQGYYEEAIEAYIQARKAWIAGESDAAEGRAIVQGLMDAEAALKSSHIHMGAPEIEIKKAYRR